MKAKLYTADGKFVADVVLAFAATVVIWGDRVFLRSHSLLRYDEHGVADTKTLMYLETDAVVAVVT